MATPSAQIRPYQANDEKVVKFTIGKASMEGLAVANRQGTYHASRDSEHMDFIVMRHDRVSRLVAKSRAWLVGLAFPRTCLCMLGTSNHILDRLAGRINRPYFEEVTSDVLRRVDVADIQGYYARSPASGFFVLEYNSSVIGLVAVDACEDSQLDQSFVRKGDDGKVTQQEKKDIYKKGTSSTATIRHIYVDEPFRKADVQDDLVAFAIRHAFTTSKDVKEIKITTSSLLGYVQKSLRNFGFTVESSAKKLGIYGWTIDNMSLERTWWERDQEKRSGEMSLLTIVLASPTGLRPHHPLIICQSSSSQTCLPVLRRLIRPTKPPSQTLLFSFLYSPPSLIGAFTPDDASLRIFDYTGRVPGYGEWNDSRQDILTAVESGTLSVVIDSVDTLASDIASDSQTFKFIKSLLARLTSRTEPSVLVLHLLACPLLSLLTQTALSPTLTHIISHPSALIKHLATEYLTQPPPDGPAEKFWSVFIPISERVYDSQRLVYGPDGAGTSTGGEDDSKEFVVELIVRGTSTEGRKRATERILDGWKGEAPEILEKLDSLKALFSRKKLDEKPPDPTQNVSFNLYLTPAQERSRGQVPLPYVHEGKSTSAAIFYEPDSADDIDDDDPDEDLDI
ncbi:hypothetical protein ID866_2153 [Astraeus odoratus]|nr:hypothetical protein ID866_2153 [Astraeus odoratus]